MIDALLGVAAQPLRAGGHDGVLFGGDERRHAWAPNGALPGALSFVVDREVCAHPWESWPNPGEPLWERPPPEPLAQPAPTKPRAGSSTERQARERRKHGS